MKKNKAVDRRNARASKGERPIIHPGASSLLSDEVGETGENQRAAGQRDLEPDDFDLGTDVSDDRIRGAGGQSLAELMISRDQGAGLDEHSGGLRHDRPEPNVNEFDPDEPSGLELEDLDDKARIA